MREEKGVPVADKPLKSELYKIYCIAVLTKLYKSGAQKGTFI
jgi:hypothetical protein